MLSSTQGGIKEYLFEALLWLDLGLNPGVPDHWWTFYSLGQWPNIYLLTMCKQMIDVKLNWY